VYSKLGTVIAVALAIFPFAAVVGKLAGSEPGTTTLVVTAICALFFVALLIASRTTATAAPEPEPEPQAAARPARKPAPPVAWSWDGVNRQPDAEEESKQDEGMKK
jgi:hypothetical protein